MGNCISEAWDDITGQSAAEQAAATQQLTSDENIALQREMFDQTRSDFSPYRDIGAGSLSQLGMVAGDTPNYSYQNFLASPESQIGSIDAFQSSPGYEFAREEGMRGIENQLSGMGLSNSGRALKELDRFNTGLANQEYGNWYNRRANEYGNFVNRLGGTQTNQYNQLMGLAGLGQASAGQTAAANQTSTNAIMQQNQLAADANAAAAMQGYQGTSNLVGQGLMGLGMYMSDRNAKTDIEDTDIGLEFIRKLRPVKYRYRGENGTSYGLIAQDVKEAMGDKDGIHGWIDGRTQGVKYHELTAPLIKAVQELSEKVERLENGNR